MSFDAEIQLLEGNFPVVGVDIHQHGAQVLSKRGWEPGTLLFLKLNDVQLGGPAEVRHSKLRKDGRYAIGLAFRGPMVPQGESWQIQRVGHSTGEWTYRDDKQEVETPSPVA